MARASCLASIRSTSPTRASSLPSWHPKRRTPGWPRCARIRSAPTRPTSEKSSQNLRKAWCCVPGSAAPGSSTCSSETRCRGSVERRRPLMCLGIPGQIVEITDPANYLAKVDVSGVRRTISVRLLGGDMPGPARWGAVPGGFAMAKIDETEALLTLAAVQKLGDAYTTELEAFDSSEI